ncbi:HEL096Cp [Eremothecium sinecaudum]|uniref:HEL096Cp n=1 Tax=Eremothecium sinecaudum TaxID=45286 RepID=A0A0X8HTJ0_9SACH|nr:HEL096Cp [Eremothecium sinecaudum]AMD21184.1 HEL096Cp [Eremothecium sinecaudum]
MFKLVKTSLVDMAGSKSKEIREKQELQARLQASFSRNASKVLEWLGDDATEKESKDLTESKSSFLKLPVVQIGAGLNLSDNYNVQDKNDIHTIGEFVKSDKNVSTLAKKKQANKTGQQGNGIYRVRKEDSKAMVALKYKVRNNQRSQLNHKYSSADVPDNSKDNESDDEPPVQRPPKKKVDLFFSSKGKKKH